MHRLHPLVARATFLALGAVTFGTAHAQLYGLSSSTPGTLYTLNTATGAATAVINLTSGTDVSFTGIDFLGGQLYATDVRVGGGGSLNFGRIDVATGAFTALSTQDGSFDWWGLAANEAAGVFYTVDYDAGNILKTVSPLGVTTVIGATGVNAQGAGLAYDPNSGTLYATAFDGNLYTLNTSTGASTLVGSLGLPSFTNVHQGLAFDAAANVLYFNEADTFDSLYRVNVTTGAATLIGSNGAVAGVGIDGLAFRSTPVPEPASLAALGLGIVALLRRRRA